jgi:hypothetical protein
MGKPPRLLPSTKPHAVLIVLVVAVFLIDLIFCFGLFFDCGFLMVFADWWFLLFALVALKFFFLLCFA